MSINEHALRNLVAGDLVDAVDGGVREAVNPATGERSLALLKLADLLEENVEELNALESANFGKPSSTRSSRTRSSDRP